MVYSKNKPALFFDLRSGSVSVTYCLLGSAPSVIFSETRYLSFSRMDSAENFVNQSVKLLCEIAEHAFSHLTKHKLALPESIDVFYTSPWFINEREEHIVHKEGVEVFSQKDLHACQQFLMNKIQAPQQGMKTIEAECITMMLNGYIIDNPFGKSYKKSTLVTYVSALEKRVCEKVESAISQHFSTRPIFHHSLPLSLTKSLNRIKPSYTGYVVVIHGEATDVCAFKHGHLVHHGSFAIGTHAALKRLAHNGSIVRDIHALIGTKKILLSKLASQKNILNQGYTIWSDELMEYFKNYPIPTDSVLIISEDEVAGEYAKEALQVKDIPHTITVFDKGQCIGQGIEVNSFSRNTHILSLIETFALTHAA